MSLLCYKSFILLKDCNQDGACNVRLRSGKLKGFNEYNQHVSLLPTMRGGGLSSPLRGCAANLASSSTVTGELEGDLAALSSGAPAGTSTK